MKARSREESPSVATSGPTAELRRRLLELEAAEGFDTVPFTEWSSAIPEPKRGDLDFRRFPYQRELYEATSEEKEVVVKKATQVGISAHCLRWAMYWADRGLTALYVFPYQRQLRDFSATRIRPMIAASEYLSTRVELSSVQSSMLKQIGKGYLVLRGSESTADLQSIDADVLVLDEYDLIVAASVPDAERRLGASELGLVRRVGVPSVPGIGIADFYARSDRRSWHVKCDACNERQPLTFMENIDPERLLRVCRRCRRPLDTSDGEWVAEFPERDVRGYHVSRLIVPNLAVASLVRDSRETGPGRAEAFSNKELGEEYADHDARLSGEAIAAAQRSYSLDGFYHGDNLVTMGVDVASTRSLHVRISEHFSAHEKRALFIGEIDDFATLAQVMDRYRVHMAAIDAQPERRLSQGFAERYAGRVYLVTYTGGPTAKGWAVEDETRHVTVPRSVAIDAALDGIRRQRNLLPSRLPPEYGTHLQAVTRIVDRDQLGRVRTTYRSTSADDYLHAEVFDVVASDLWNYRCLVTEASRARQPKPFDGFWTQPLDLEGDVSALEADYYPGFAEYDVLQGFGP